MAKVFTKRFRTMGDMLMTVMFNVFLTTLVWIAFYNPTGFSYVNWLASSLGSPVSSADFAAFWARLTSGALAPDEWRNVIGVAAAVALSVFILLRAPGWMATILLAALTAAIGYMLVLMGITPLQALIGVVLLGAVVYCTYLVPRYLKAAGTLFVLLVVAAILWQLSNWGLFSATNSTLLQWALLIVLGILSGLASSTGFVLRWWQGRLSVEDVDTNEDHQHDDHPH